MRINLNRLSVIEILKFSKNIKEKCKDYTFMEEAVQDMMKYLYCSFITDNCSNPFALVRFFKSCSYRELPNDVRTYIQNKWQKDFTSPQSKYLTLLGTWGDLEGWCDRRRSQNHIAFPLDDPQFPYKYPMILALLTQIGFPLRYGVNFEIDSLINNQYKSYGLSCIENVKGEKSLPELTSFANAYLISARTSWTRKCARTSWTLFFDKMVVRIW